MAQKIKGKCKFCGKEYAYSYMGRHLAACKERQKRIASETGKKQCGYFDLAVYPSYGKDYWLFIEMKETATLRDLDAFLRDIWLECCGHMSAFTIDGVSYEAAPQLGDFWGEPAKSMNCKLKTVLSKGMTFDYEYDFGSTTELRITVVNYQIHELKKEKLTLLSRNNPYEYVCSKCGKSPAVAINPEEWWEVGSGLLCEDCCKPDDCDDDEDYDDAYEYLLKVCNSPRMGVCGYDGSDCYPDQFVSDVETSD